MNQLLSFFVMGIAVASSYYINNSNPSPYHSSSGASGSSDAPAFLPTIQHNTEEPKNAPSPSPSPQLSLTPPQALVFLTSSKMRQGLSIAHAITAEAVKVTSKTVDLVDGMIENVIAGSDTRTPESTPRPSQPLSPGPSLPEPTGPETLTPTLRSDTTLALLPNLTSE
jgi:spartin